jgi:transposase InsO family protein
MVYYPIKDRLMQVMKDETAQDPTLNALGEMIQKGWPNERKQVPENLLPFFSCRDEFTVKNGVMMRGERVIIPENMKKEMKKRVHTGHMGINSCVRLAKDVMYWPRMTSEIRQYVEACSTCATFSDSQPKETPVITEIPKRPWEKLAADLLSWGGDDYLVLTDYYSNFIEVDKLRYASSAEVIQTLKKHFARNGSPYTLVSDNGTQFTAQEFKQFSEDWGFYHDTMSPGNSQANGAAEAAVKIIKRIFRKSKTAREDPYKGLLNYYNTPTEGMGTCPAQRLLGRRTRSMLPLTHSKVQPSPQDDESEQQKKELKRHKRASVSRGRDLKPLTSGQTVRMQPINGSREWKEGTVIKPLTTRSYEVAANGRTYVRNRRHLRARPSASTHTSPTMVGRRRLSRRIYNPEDDDSNNTTPTGVPEASHSEGHEDAPAPNSDQTAASSETTTSTLPEMPKSRYGRVYKPTRRLINEME